MAEAGSGRKPQLDTLEDEVTEVTALLRKNVERVLERGERIDSLQERSANLEFSSTNFRTTTVLIRRKMWRRNLKLACSIGVVIFVVVVVITIIVVAETEPWNSGSGGKHNGTSIHMARKMA